MRLFQRIMMVCIMTAMVAPIAMADLYYETRITGQPGRTEPGLSKTYMSEIGTRMETPEGTATIINYKEEAFIELNLKDKTYTLTKFENFMKATGVENEEMAAQMEKMMEQMLGSLEVTRTEETQEINGYKCTKVLVSMMGNVSDYWVTKEVKDYAVLIGKLEKYKDVFSKNQFLKNMTSGFEMQKKIDGFPIKTVNKMMGMEIVSETIKVESKSIDAALFMPPKDFTKVEQKE